MLFVLVFALFSHADSSYDDDPFLSPSGISGAAQQDEQIPSVFKEICFKVSRSLTNGAVFTLEACDRFGRDAVQYLTSEAARDRLRFAGKVAYNTGAFTWWITKPLIVNGGKLALNAGYITCTSLYGLVMDYNKSKPEFA